MRALAGIAIGGSLLAVTIAFTASGGCLRQTEFHCSNNADCGASGTCEPQGYCSFFDSSCAGSQQRFADSAGPFANACVGGNTGSDGGPDDGPDLDAPDGTPPGCPPDYMALPGVNNGHVYRVAANSQNWSGQHNSCVASAPGHAYLAIPDDAAELMALSTAINVPVFWVGIIDAQTEGTFLNSKGMPQLFLPWVTGAPDDAGPGEDCVSATSATQTINDERCNTQYRAVCECEP
ncbi:MAG TPA: lectin-like protein [Kofleriaceae bacterium]|nr:lectin-like protein [Kofleriaceae bacterium]